MSEWRVYCPDDGETSDDAVLVRPYVWDPIFDAEHAAQIACRNDFEDRGGHERGLDVEFVLVIIAPGGTETKWACVNKPSVIHRARELTQS